MERRPDVLETLSPSDTVQTGDRLRLTFSAGGLFRGLKRELIIKRLESQRLFRVDDVRYTDTELVITTTVVENPFPVALVAGAVIAAAASAFVYLSLVKVERIIESPAGALAVGGIGAVFVAVAAAIILPMVTRRT